ncbi:MAG: gliding motility-associated C-terminal domain-containing protein [Saprospiraceae bacterium]|nr:gliding motility-associated C-terminal domain-containing protein [Saprospiraceae bacterium]
MRRSNRFSLGISSILLLLLPVAIFSQSITYQNPSDFSACGEATFSVTVQNIASTAMNGATVTVNFTTTTGAACGIEYVPGSVSAPVGQSNISNLSAPKFSLPSLAAGASQTFSLQVQTNCQTAACIDNAEVFVNQISVNWSGGNASVTTSPYVIDRALLLFTNVSSTVMSGSRDDILQRNLTIRNTRPGAISSFILRDIYQSGINISSAQGTVLSSSQGDFALQLGPNDFASIGDGDGLFEFNESIVVTEDIQIWTCGVDQASSVSNITASWGCAGDTCQQENVTAVVIFEQYDKVPSLAFEPIVNVPECFCGPDGILQGMKITNAGDGRAHDVHFIVQIPLQSPREAIDSLSVQVVGSGGPLPFVYNMGDNVAFQFQCDAPNPLSEYMDVTILEIPAGETVTVYWNMYYCSNGCSQPTTTWLYKYSYLKECPPNILVENTTFTTVKKSNDFMATRIDLKTQGIVHDGELQTGVFVVDYTELTSSADVLSVDMELPCGMEWVPSNPLLLNGQAPLNVNVVAGDSATFVTANYQLPMAVDTGRIEFDFIFHCDEVCEGALPCEYQFITTCGQSCYSPVPPTFTAFFTTTLLECDGYPAVCNVQSCNELAFPYDCDYDSICVDAPPGYLRYDFKAQRKNYGLPDSNNDRLPDAPTGLPDMNLVSKYRLLPGDTIQTTVKGEVHIDKPGTTLPLGELKIHFVRMANLALATQEALMTPTRLSQAGVKLRVFDKSANTWYQCTDPPFSTSAKITYEYDFEALKGICLPADFAFDEGDSLDFVGNYRIGYNPSREVLLGEPDPMKGDFMVIPELAIYDSLYEKYTKVNCNCQTQLMELSYYEYSMVANAFGVPPCEASQYGTPFNLKLDIFKGNFFPFEYRNLLVMEDIRMTVPPNIQICSTRVVSLRWQNGNSFVSNFYQGAPPIVNGEYVLDLKQFQLPPVDEGFAGTFEFIFKDVCNNRFSMPMTFATHLDWASGLPPNHSPPDTSITNNLLRPLIANLSIQAPLYDLVSNTNRMDFDFLFKNTPTIVGNQSSGAAPNTWLYVTSPTGLVTDFQLIDQTTGQPVPFVNGLFQLGDLPINTTGFPYRLVATNNSCERERLFIHYGWNCDPLLNPVQIPCYEQVLPLYIESPPGEIDMIVNSPSGCSQLCDTIPYHTIEVFNAQFGSVYNLRLKALVPPGFSAISGSTVVEYPTGSGSLYPIGDPTVVSTGVLEWNLSMLFDSIATGLPGVGAAPYNSLTLKFLGESTCDFVANAYTLFIAAAEQNCGIPSNSIAKPADAICIDGVTGPYATNINVTPSPGFACNDVTKFEVSLTSSAVLPQGACLIATLPPGITYVPGSCLNMCVPNLNCNPTIDGSQITWQLPQGTLVGQLVCFSFNTQGWSGLGCENGVILFRSAAETQALCALTGDSCSTKVSTGSLILPFDPQRPAYDLSEFTITATAAGANTQVVANVKLTNNGAASQPPTIVQFYADTNGDGTGDVLLGTQNYGFPILGGQTVTVGANFTVPAAMNLCQLLAVVDASQQCACSGDVETVTMPITFNTGLAWTVCSGTDQVVGIAAMPGFDYQWSPDSDCLGSLTAATTNFNCVNDGFAPETTQFTITSTNGVCETANLLEVTVQPVPGIAYADSPICPGESANIAATEGVSFTWQGPGVAQQNQQIITVTPTVTSQYSVTVLDAFGCSGTETATVTVAPQPVVNAGADQAFCPGESPQLNATFDPDWDYLWSPQFVGGFPALSGSTIHNPLVTTGQTTTFTVSVLDENGCSATDAVTISFADSLVLTMPADLTICLGSSATLTATTNLPATFTWSPSGTCVNPPSCSNWLVTPLTTTTYTATAQSADGCAAIGNVKVTVTNDLIVTNGPLIEICEGETLVINGETITEPGIYCDTIDVAGGCDSVYCVEVLVRPGIDTMTIDTAICLGASVVFEGQTYTDEGEYCVTLPGQNGCDSVRCLVLQVDDLGIKITVDSAICVGDSVLFEGQVYTDPGEYCVTYATPEGCDSTRCLNLSVNPLPIIEITGLDTVSAGDTLLLELDPGGTFNTILWFANDSLLADCSGQLSCEAFPTDSLVVYTVQLTGADANCPGTDSLAVTVIPGCDPEKVGIPNAFSPNHDQLNDTFGAVSPGSEVMLHLTVWNRWGQTVHDGPDPWDGMQNGKPAQSDVYIFVMKVGCALPVEDMEKEHKGHVTLLR